MIRAVRSKPFYKPHQSTNDTVVNTDTLATERLTSIIAWPISCLLDIRTHTYAFALITSITAGTTIVRLGAAELMGHHNVFNITWGGPKRREPTGKH